MTETTQQTKRRWQPDEVKTLRSMIAEGRRHAEIAAALGRTPGSISHKCRYVGIQPREDWLTAQRPWGGHRKPSVTDAVHSA
jgi:hypothetical protein